MFKKNTAVTGFGIGHFINTTTGASVTSGTPTCMRVLSGTAGACANAASYNTSAAVWEIDLAAGDLNADMVIFSFALTSCLPISYSVKTVTGVPDSNGFMPSTIKQVSDDGTAADNLELACDNYSATRGLSGTALPAAAADAAGGLPISDAGGLDLDTKLSATNEITQARMQELDAGTAGKMAHQVDIIQTDTTTDIPASLTALAAVLNVCYTWNAGKVIDKVGAPGTYQVLDPDDDLTVVLEFVLGATTPYKDVTIV